MRVFVTGATGFIGSAVVPELIGAGHEVVGLARSDASAAALAAAGAEVHRGDLDDLESLRSGAAAADGVIHCAFIHDFTQLESLGPHRPPRRRDASARRSRAPTGPSSSPPGSGCSRPDAWRPRTTRPIPPRTPGTGCRRRWRRSRSRRAACARRSSGSRRRCTARATTASSRCWSTSPGARASPAYVGDGSNRWPAVHRLDAARLFRLALEAAPAGSVLHGVAEEGVPTREIAEVIGRHLDVPVTAIAPEDAERPLRLARGVLRGRRPRVERADAGAARLEPGAAGAHRRPRRGPLLRGDARGRGLTQGPYGATTMT